MTDKKVKAKTKAELFPPMKTRVGGSVSVDKDGKVAKTVTKKKAKLKTKDTTDKDKDDGTN